MRPLVRLSLVGMLALSGCGGLGFPTIRDLSGFDEFSLRRFGLFLDPGTMTSATIRRVEAGKFAVRFELFVAHQGDVGSCPSQSVANDQYYCVEIVPERVLTNDEVADILGVFEAVVVERSPHLICYLLSFNLPDTFQVDIYVWDDLRLDDNICGFQRIGREQEPQIQTVLERLIVR